MCWSVQEDNKFGNTKPKKTRGRFEEKLGHDFTNLLQGLKNSELFAVAPSPHFDFCSGSCLSERWLMELISTSSWQGYEELLATIIYPPADAYDPSRRRPTDYSANILSNLQSCQSNCVTPNSFTGVFFLFPTPDSIPTLSRRVSKESAPLLDWNASMLARRSPRHHTLINQDSRTKCNYSNSTLEKMR